MPDRDWDTAIPCNHRYPRHLAAAHVVYVNNVYQGATLSLWYWMEFTKLNERLERWAWQLQWNAKTANTVTYTKRPSPPFIWADGVLRDSFKAMQTEG